MTRARIAPHPRVALNVNFRSDNFKASSLSESGRGTSGPIQRSVDSAPFASAAARRGSAAAPRASLERGESGAE